MADREVVKRHNYKFEHISNIEKVNQSKILLCLILSSSEVTKNCLSQFLLIFFILFLLRKISNSVIWYPIMRHRNWSRAAVLFNNNFQLAQSPTAMAISTWLCILYWQIYLSEHIRINAFRLNLPLGEFLMAN